MTHLADLLSFAQSGYPPHFHSRNSHHPIAFSRYSLEFTPCHQSDCSWAICPIKRPKKTCGRISRKSASPTQIVRPLDRETGRARGFAFVEYAERTAAEEAIKKFDGQLFMGRPLAVSEARAREDRGPGGPPRPGGGYGAPRPGGFSGGGGGFGGGGGGFGGPRPAAASAAAVAATAAAAPGAGGARQKDFGPPAPPKDKKKPFKKNEDKPQRPDPDEVHGPHV